MSVIYHDGKYDAKVVKKNYIVNFFERILIKQLKIMLFMV